MGPKLRKRKTLSNGRNGSEIHLSESEHEEVPAKVAKRNRNETKCN